MKTLSELHLIGQVSGNIKAWRMGIRSAEQSLANIEKRIDEYEQRLQDMLDDISEGGLEDEN